MIIVFTVNIDWWLHTCGSWKKQCNRPKKVLIKYYEQGQPLNYSTENERQNPHTFGSSFLLKMYINGIKLK